MKRKTKNYIITIISTIIFAALYFYLFLPALSIHSTELPIYIIVCTAFFALLFKILESRGIGSVFDNASEYNRGFKFKSFSKFAKTIWYIIGICVLLMVIGDVAGWKLFNATSYRNLLKVEEGNFTQDIKEISFNNIPSLDSASASKLGNRKLGDMSDVVSQFEIRDDYTQINYKGRPVRVTTLRYGDIIKWINNTGEGIPAYLYIDMVTQEVTLVRLDKGIKYTPDEHFGKNLERHIRFNYPTFIFEDYRFEINDEGTPYWICPRVSYKIGLYGGKDIIGAVMVNAVTGESKYYELADIPNWVDRVFNADLLIEQFDNYGTLTHGYFNSIFGQKDSKVTTDGYNYLAMNDDVFMYSGVTSVTGDQSNIGFILINQRTKATKFYPVTGAEEYSAMSSAEGIVQDLNYTATFPLLLNVGNTPTYFIALKDAGELVKMYAMVNVSQYQIVATGQTIAECEKNYLSLLKVNKISDPDVYKSIKGKITDIRTAVIDGNTYYYFNVEGSDLTFYISVKSNNAVVMYNIGNQIEIKYVTSNQKLLQINEVKLVS